MKTPTNNQEWIETLWALDGISYSQAGQAIGYAKKTVAARAQRHRFRRVFGCWSSRWTEGPCISCGEVSKADDLNEDRECERCERQECEEAAGAAVDAAAEEEEAHGIDLAWERQKHRERMGEREEGVRPRLPEPVVFQWSGGDHMGSTGMPGAVQ